jgi:hypothetical protein
MGRQFGHQRHLGHAGLGVDLEADEIPIRTGVEAEIRSANSPAAKGAVRRKRQIPRPLVNIW